MPDLTPEQLDEIERRAKAHGTVSLYPSTVLSLIAEVRRLRTERETACEALAESLEDGHPQRNNLCWLAGRAEAVVRDYNRLVRHVTNG